MIGRVGSALCVAGWCATALPRAANAQQSMEVTRRELLQQAQHEADAGHPAQALDLASRAAQIAMTPSLRAFLAQQQLVNNLPVEALGNAQTCVREATADVALVSRTQILSACRTVVTAAAPRIGHVNVHVPPEHAGLTVTVGSTTLNDAVLGVPFAVDPGDVTVQATGPGMIPFRATVHSVAGQTVEVPVVWTAEPSHVVAERHATAEAPRERVTIRPASSSGPPAGAVALVIGGGAALVAGGIFMGLYANDVGQLNNPNNCIADGMGGYSCYPSAAGLRNDGSTFGTVGIIALGVGAVAAGAGIVWWAIGSRREERAPQAWVAPTDHGAIVGIGGAL